MSRIYNRTSLISSVKPLLIFVEVDPNRAAFKSKQNSEAFVTTLATKCLENKISGIVLHADEDQSADSLKNTEIISLIKQVD